MYTAHPETAPLKGYPPGDRGASLIPDAAANALFGARREHQGISCGYFKLRCNTHFKTGEAVLACKRSISQLANFPKQR
jgi:hypothetical protein